MVKNLRLFRPNGLLVSATKDSLQFITILPIYLYNQPTVDILGIVAFHHPNMKWHFTLAKTGSDTFLEGFNGHHDTYDTFQTRDLLRRAPAVAGWTGIVHLRLF